MFYINYWVVLSWLVWLVLYVWFVWLVCIFRFVFGFYFFRGGSFSVPGFEFIILFFVLFWFSFWFIIFH